MTFMLKPCRRHESKAALLGLESRFLMKVNWIIQR